ncbi:ferredoxin [Candidatus Woesearchaeota archaeon]|nr:ferredoxin [Candidatus Woesearchaeota archaeon]
MAKYTIEYDRDGCIGAGGCVSADPDNWQMGDDGKANVLKKDIEESELEANKQAAESCPVGVIHIVDNETGERVI